MSPGPQRVLFVCLGNSCRSQMAEGFARAYGKDVMRASSAGLAPAVLLSPETRKCMAEKNIDLEDHFPKGLDELQGSEFDLVVNMSGFDLPKDIPAAPVQTWAVRDPIQQSEKVYREVRDEIETLVMRLILELRRRQKVPKEG